MHASVDAVVAADVLAYVGACDGVFEESARVLKPYGRLVFTLEETASDGFGLGDGGAVGDVP